MCENDAVLIENAEVNISQCDAGTLCITSKLMTAFNERVRVKEEKSGMNKSDRAC